MTYGLTPEGFKPKTFPDLLKEIEEAEKVKVSRSLNLLPSSVLGQINGIFVDKLRELWDVALAVYASQYPDTAEDQALDNVAMITGVIRQRETKSTVTLTVNIDDGVTLDVGRIVSVGQNGPRFVTVNEVENNTGAGGDFEVEAEAEEFGPIVGNSGTIDTIQTPVSGWNSVTNQEDAERGRNRESDQELRIRRLELLRQIGAATLEAIRAKVRGVDGVEQAIVFENTSIDYVGGLPPKSFEVLVSGGDDAEIARTIFLTKPIGIQSFGSLEIQVRDSQGSSHKIYFSRPIKRKICIDVNVLVDSTQFPGDGKDQIKQALVDLGNKHTVGDDVFALRFRCVPLSIAGVLDVLNFKIYTCDPPVITGNIPIEMREVAFFDTGNIIVTVST